MNTNKLQVYAAASIPFLYQLDAVGQVTPDRGLLFIPQYNQRKKRKNKRRLNAAGIKNAFR